MARPVMRPRRSKPASSTTRSSRNRIARKRVSYAEPASDPEEDDSQDQFEPEAPKDPPRRSLTASHMSIPAPVSTKKRKAVKAGRGRPSKHRTSSVKVQRRQTQTTQDVGENVLDIRWTGMTMPWQTLPYHILKVIFDYAASPLIAENFSPNPSVSWLVRMACLCKGFAEPALSVLYAAPPLYPPARVRQLIAHLETQSETSFINYRAKIKRIDLEALHILGRKSAGYDPIDIWRFLVLTPQLRGVGMHSLSDNPKWCRSLAQGSRKTTYQPDILSMMWELDIRLQDWTWNGALFGEKYSLRLLQSVHLTPPFQTLRSLTFVAYTRHNFNGIDGTSQPVDTVLAQALKVLPTLKSLAFRRSPMFNEALLSGLPSNLHSLEVTDCPIHALHVEDFLRAKGSELRRLVLNHNSYLNLSWLPVLGYSSPMLEVLQMDLIYFNIYATVSDPEPKYAFLLSASNMPTWPPSLQVLELHHLRKWSKKVAEMFFSSLVDSAPSLPNLRHLRIKASLDESGWRERVAFRDKWVQRLQQVFLRISAPPNPHLKSIAAYKAHKARQKDSGNLDDGVNFRHVEVPIRDVPSIDGKIHDRDNDKPLARRRHSRRIVSAKDYNESSSSSNSVQLRTSRRRRRPKDLDGSSAEDSALEDDAIGLSARPARLDGDDAPAYMQGMCDVVDVMIDNLRPTEEQLHESDFLDDEVSGDEDWNGDDEIPSDGGYAW